MRHLTQTLPSNEASVQLTNPESLRKTLTRLLLLILVVLGFQSPAYSQAKLAGLWEFDDPNNTAKATVGKDLVFEGLPPGWASDSVDDHGTMLRGLLSTPPPAKENMILARHGIAPKRGEKYVNKYSIVADIFSPEKSRNAWRSIFQARQANTDDGEYFIRNDNNNMGTSRLGYSKAEIDETKWTRLVLTFDLTSRGGDAIAYLDGKLFHKHSPDLQIDGRYSLGTGLKLFADDSGDNAQLIVNAIAIYDGVLTASEVAAIGKVGTPIAKPQLPPRFIVETYGVDGQGQRADVPGHFIGIQDDHAKIVQASKEAAWGNKFGVETIERVELQGGMVALKTGAGYLPDLAKTVGAANQYKEISPMYSQPGDKRFVTLQLANSNPHQYLRHGGLKLYNSPRHAHEAKGAEHAQVFEQDVTWHFHEAPSRRFTLADAKRILMGQWKANLEKTEDRFGRSAFHEELAKGIEMTFSANSFVAGFTGATSRFTKTRIEGPTADEHFRLHATDASGAKHVEDLQILDNDHIIFKSDAGRQAIIFDRSRTTK
ncbi:LamG domain-containing protein [bacterium]|nr:LamG domain-containing protein [bacterium]